MQPRHHYLSTWSEDSPPVVESVESNDADSSGNDETTLSNDSRMLRPFVPRDKRRLVSTVKGAKTVPRLARDKLILDDKAIYNDFIRHMSCKLDPFGTASIQLDRTTSGLLQYYLYQHHPPIWRYEPSSLPHESAAFTGAVSRRVNLAFSDALIMHCILSAAASRMRWANSVRVPGYFQQEFSSTQQALGLLQDEIKRGRFVATPERMVSCITFLGCAETYRGDYTAAKTHRDAAVKLLNPIGDLMQLQDEYVRGQLLMLDISLSCALLEPCSLRCDYDPGPLDEIGLSTSELLPLETDIFAKKLLSKSREVLPAPLRSLVAQIIECNNLKRRLTTGLILDGHVLEVERWITLRTAAIRNRLLALTGPSNKVDALRVALLMWTLLPTSTDDIRQARIVKVMAPKLKIVLERSSKHEWSNNEDVRFWLLIIGHCCTEEGSTLQSWFGEHIYRVRKLQGKDFGVHIRGSDLEAGLVKFQEGFLFQELIQRAPTQKLAEWLLWWDNFLDRVQDHTLLESSGTQRENPGMENG